MHPCLPSACVNNHTAQAFELLEWLSLCSSSGLAERPSWGVKAIADHVSSQIQDLSPDQLSRWLGLMQDGFTQVLL